MNNLQLQFADANNSPFGGKKLLFTPTKAPQITASWMATFDSYQFTTSLDGTLSSSIVSNIYKVDVGSPLPAFSFYLQATETGSYVVSASIQTGSAQDVYFDLFNLVKNPLSVKKLTLTPTWNYPNYFSGSIIALSSTSSIPSGGYSDYNSLVPGIYQCDALGKVDTTFFISVPSWHNTGSGTWNAKDLLVIKPTKGIAVRLNNLDNSYVLTVSSSDARYALKINNNCIAITQADYDNLNPVPSTIYFVYDTTSYIFSDGSGGFWQLIVDVYGNLGTTSISGPPTSDVILSDGSGGFWKLIIDSLGLRGAQSMNGPATDAIILTDDFGGQWQVIVDTEGNLGTISV